MPYIGSYPEKTTFETTDHVLGYKADGSVQVFPGLAFVAAPVPQISPDIAAATDNAVARFDGSTGAHIQNSNAFIDDSGNFAVNGQPLAVGVGTARISALLDDPTLNTGLALASYNAFVSGASFTFSKTRATSPTSHTIVNADDNLGAIAAYGSDGVGYASAAGISFLVDGTPGTNDMPGRIVFSTTADGANSATERLRIDNAGDIHQGLGAAGKNNYYYNLFTNFSNYERGVTGWSSNVFQVGSEALGTGTGRATYIKSALATNKYVYFNSPTASRDQLLVGSDGNDPIIRTDAANGVHFTLRNASGAGAGVFGFQGDSGLINFSTSNPVSMAAGIGFDVKDAVPSTSSFVFDQAGTNRNGISIVQYQVDGYLTFPGRTSVDEAKKDLWITGAPALASASTNLSGGNIRMMPGQGAANSSGAAQGGSIFLDGGRSFGQSPDGNVNIGATRGRLITKWMNWDGAKRLNADFSKTSSVTFSDIVGSPSPDVAALSVTLLAGRTYVFEAHLICSCGAGGVQARMSGTCVVSNIIYDGWILDSTLSPDVTTMRGYQQATALNTMVAGGLPTGPLVHIHIHGTIAVSSSPDGGGSFTVQFAQWLSNATASTVKRGSYMLVRDVV